MALTRFKGRDGKDGPVSGSLVVLPIDIGTIGTNTTVNKRFHLPAGMNLEIVDAVWSASAVGSDPSFTSGTTNGGTQIVAAVNLVTGTADGQSLTIKDGNVGASGSVHVRIVTDTGDSVTGPAQITLIGYVSAPPTSARVRAGDHY